MKVRRKVNTKRRLRKPPDSETEMNRLAELASKASYGGNPAHKRNPGDFGLNPPSEPREGKTLCDASGVVKRADAEALLEEGLRRGLISVQERNGWPQNVWAAHKGRIPMEAMLENPEMGTYHGYPMLSYDPLYHEVLKRWNAK